MLIIWAGESATTRHRDVTVLRFDDAGSVREGEIIVPPQQRQFLYKAKGKARATRSLPSILPTSLPPVIDSQINGASTSSSHASSGLRPWHPNARGHPRTMTTPPSPRRNDGKPDLSYAKARSTNSHPLSSRTSQTQAHRPYT